MKTKRINGFLFEKMLYNGAANLKAKEQKLNALNVFPVADGDTGTNMYLTLAHGLKAAASGIELGAYLKTLTDGMLLGARGNSGVILSQLFRGIFTELSRCGAANPGDMRNAFIRGYKTAYASVIQPVEGTILTVAREGIEHIKAQVDRSTVMETLFSMYAAEMRKSLSYTPEMLPALKEAGVVDSGALGYILIIEGMLKYLYGENLKISGDTPGKGGEEFKVNDDVAPELFNENTVFEDGYCLTFVLQLMNGARYSRRFILNAYIEDLKAYGSSLVVVQNGKRVKVHIHTLKPERVISESRVYGEFLSFKLDNMQLQHNARDKKKPEAPLSPFAVVAVLDGEGWEGVYGDLGCKNIIRGGASMNVSSQEFIDALKKVNAKTIALLPNNKNSVRSAEQAVALSGMKNVRVLPSGCAVEGYFALAMDVADSPDADYRLGQLSLGMSGVVTLQEATASRGCLCGGKSCAAGDEIVLINGQPACSGGGRVELIVQALRSADGIEDKESCALFRGEDVTEQEEAELENRLNAEFPNLECSFFYGGQSVYHWQIGII